MVLMGAVYGTCGVGWVVGFGRGARGNDARPPYCFSIVARSWREYFTCSGAEAPSRGIPCRGRLGGNNRGAWGVALTRNRTTYKTHFYLLIPDFLITDNAVYLAKACDPPTPRENRRGEGALPGPLTRKPEAPLAGCRCQMPRRVIR